MQSLTDIQQAVYDFTTQVQNEGLPFPSLREIANQFGFKHTTARFHLKALEKKGYIKQRSQRVSDYMLANDGLANDGLANGSLANDSAEPASEFNLVAKIPAGAPSAVFDESDETFSVNHEFFGGGDIQGIRVVGESMSGDSITEGDIAMIKLQQDYTKTDILAVRIDGEITLKRIKLIGDRCQLLPSNPEVAVREVSAQQLQIIGKLVGIIRKT